VDSKEAQEKCFVGDCKSRLDLSGKPTPGQRGIERTKPFTKANLFEIGPFLSLGQERLNLIRDCILKCP
jgi:hypothetical protein